jgi:hypothetical protein
MGGSGANGLGANGLGAKGFGTDSLGKDSFCTNGFGLIARRQRSFAELVFDLSSDDEDELNAAPDEEDWAGQARDSLRGAFLIESKLLVGKRECGPDDLGDRLEIGLGNQFLSDDHLHEGEREHPLTSCADQVSAQDRLEAPSYARDYSGAQPPEPLAELARMLGRGWARDRRTLMGKGLGGGLGLLK